LTENFLPLWVQHFFISAAVKEKNEEKFRVNLTWALRAERLALTLYWKIVIQQRQQ
jgi:hypothetical protein